MKYQICIRCVMDSSDPEITYDESGICNHCRHFDNVTSKGWFPNEEGDRRLKLIIEQIKADSDELGISGFIILIATLRTVNGVKNRDKAAK